jgi:cytoskeletal protein CcmA (bactofilin family)
MIRRRVGAGVVTALGLTVLFLLTAPLTALAAEVRQGQDLAVPSSETVNDDLYIFAGKIDVEGTVNGSALVFGGTITVGGTVTRDLMASGGNINVTGDVKGSIRMAGGTLTLNGPVGEDVVIAGGTITLGEKAQVGRDLLVAGGTVIVNGPIGRKILAGSGELTLRGPVGGDVQAYTDRLRLENGAVIQGSLTYWSNNEAVITSGAKVQGRIERREPEGRNRTPGPVMAFLGWLKALIGLLALGLILLLVFPGLSSRAAATLRGSPGASLGLGAALLVGIPLVALIVFIVGLFVGGWWIGLLAIAGYILALIVGYLVSGLLAGQWILQQLKQPAVHPAWPLVVGVLALSVIGLAPIVGWIINLVAVVVGLGALALALARNRRPPATTTA